MIGLNMVGLKTRWLASEQPKSLVSGQPYGWTQDKLIGQPGQLGGEQQQTLDEGQPSDCTLNSYAARQNTGVKNGRRFLFAFNRVG